MHCTQRMRECFLHVVRLIGPDGCGVHGATGRLRLRLHLPQTREVVGARHPGLNIGIANATHTRGWACSRAEGSDTISVLFSKNYSSCESPE